MYSTAYSRKISRGRPCRFRSNVSSYLETKKSELFDADDSSQEVMSLINLAYRFSKITKEEYDTANFLEILSSKMRKHSGVKTMPSCSPHMWNSSMQNMWNSVIYYDNNTIEQLWKKIKDYVHARNPNICNEFFGIISHHHSYEELYAIKLSTFAITNLLKEGLQIVYEMFELGLC